MSTSPVVLVGSTVKNGLVNYFRAIKKSPFNNLTLTLDSFSFFFALVSTWTAWFTYTYKPEAVHGYINLLSVDLCEENITQNGFLPKRQCTTFYFAGGNGPDALSYFYRSGAVAFSFTLLALVAGIYVIQNAAKLAFEGKKLNCSYYARLANIGFNLIAWVVYLTLTRDHDDSEDVVDYFAGYDTKYNGAGFGLNILANILSVLALVTFFFGKGASTDPVTVKTPSDTTETVEPKEVAVAVQDPATDAV